MKAVRFSPLPFLFFGVALVTSSAVVASAQKVSGRASNASGLLSQLSAAFSGGKAVQRVQMSGSATWQTGSLEDFGAVSLTASADGSSEMQLSLASRGQRTETQTAGGPDATCQWAGTDGVSHEIRSGSCWRSALWFLPALSLQTSLLPGNLAVSDLGAGAVGSENTAYRHLRSLYAVSGLPSARTTDIAQQSTADLGLDPGSLLPAVFAYSVHPDNGAQVAIAIEVRYSDYRIVDGAQIPFHIQRYVNGSLQLDILLTSAQIN